MNIVFIDVNTTGVDPNYHQIWEIGVIVRDRTDPGGHVDIEYAWQIRPSLVGADSATLRFTRYYERNNARTGVVGMAWRLEHPGLLAPQPDGEDTNRWTHTTQIADELAVIMSGGAIIVGANPWVPERFLTRFLGEHDHVATHDENLIDVVALAAGGIPLPPPWFFGSILATYGIDESNDITALGDVRMIRDLFDMVYMEDDKDDAAAIDLTNISDGAFREQLVGSTGGGQLVNEPTLLDGFVDELGDDDDEVASEDDSEREAPPEGATDPAAGNDGHQGTARNDE